MSTLGETIDKAEWEDLKNKLLQREYRMLIGGQLVGAQGGETYETYSPSTGELLGSVPFAQSVDVHAAVDSAKKAFEFWRKTPPLDRAKMLKTLVKEFKKRAQQYAVLDAVNGGNPVTAMLSDVFSAVDMMEYVIGMVTELKGETIPSSGINWHLTRREPYGVIGKIIPFNHPIMFTAEKIVAPLIAGNTVVLKAPDQSPLSSLLFAEICQSILPPGVVNILTGDGPITGNALVCHPAVKRIALIGSVGTGKAILKSSADVAIKHVSLELGGKNAMIVYPDADIEKAVEGAVGGMNFMWCQGQSCGSTSRLFLHEDIYDEFIERLIKRVGQIKLGLPIDPETEMGCLVSQPQFDRVMGYIKSGLEQGATLVVGGEKPKGSVFQKGHFVEPTVFTNVTEDMKIFKEEIFGPVLSLICWNEKEDVIRQVNALPYGLTASIWTNHLPTAFETIDRIEAGFIWVNGSSRHFLGVPYQGFKDSGIGSEEGLDEILSYTQVKTVNIMME
ncbi:aldehyde dehydrogenase family protein [Neobacillus cucumis]|uniref:aldehyde dehydrogenase family protein n=1 Tax=Neobacillus cucumis TaxID=1740721 RepID=UPI00203AD76C|nr:aldehyde dehydrogenase family protein [Neobacillus cucumis]MCM3728878.1 aldehyde dehydrogenase family protein [Neobacillus cucumis]